MSINNGKLLHVVNQRQQTITAKHITRKGCHWMEHNWTLCSCRLTNGGGEYDRNGVVSINYFKSISIVGELFYKFTCFQCL